MYTHTYTYYYYYYYYHYYYYTQYYHYILNNHYAEMLMDLKKMTKTFTHLQCALQRYLKLRQAMN